MKKEPRYSYRVKVAGKPDFVGCQVTMAMATRSIGMIAQKSIIDSVTIEKESEGIANVVKYQR